MDTPTIHVIKSLEEFIELYGQPQLISEYSVYAAQRFLETPQPDLDEDK